MAEDKPAADDAVKEAVEALEEAQQGWKRIYDAAAEDLEFYLGDNQWSEADKANRRRRRKPCLVNNRLPQFVHQVANDIRQNTPTIKAIPADSKADPETAELIQDLIRNIEQVSSADAAYDTAAESAIKCSIGFFQIDHDYVSPDTFEQHILIRRVPNALACIIDPNSIAPDGSDSRYGFKLDVMHEDAFKAEYPDAVPETFDSRFISAEAKAFSCAEKHITIAEWFAIEPQDTILLLLDNGLIVEASQYEMLVDKRPVINQRTVKKNIVKRRKVTGAEVLKETIFPSSYVPLIPVYGEEHWIKGERHLLSLIRNAKDPQRQLNHWTSLESELLMKAPKAPWLAAVGVVDGFPEWADPDGAEVLRHHLTDAKGNPAPPPQRNAPPPIPTGVVNARASVVEDIKAAMGMYNPSLGQEAPEKSGRAILARQHQADTATFHFGDNLRRSIEHGGRIIVDMIPRIYDTPRILRVTGEDGTQRNVAVNGARLVDPKDRMHDITVGKYDVIVTTGPSYASKRMEAAEAMMQLAQGNPQIAQIVGDLLVKNLNIPGGETLAARLKKMVPPQFQDDADDEVPDLRPQMQQAQQAMQEAQGIIAQLQGEIAALQREAGNKAGDQQLKAAELEIKMRELALKEREATMNELKAFADIKNQERETDIQAIEAETGLVSAHLDAQTTALASQMQAEGEVAVAHINALAGILQDPAGTETPPA